MIFTGPAETAQSPSVAMPQMDCSPQKVPQGIPTATRTREFPPSLTMRLSPSVREPPPVMTPERSQPRWYKRLNKYLEHGRQGLEGISLGPASVSIVIKIFKKFFCFLCHILTMPIHVWNRSIQSQEKEVGPMGHVYADTDRTTSPTQNTERCDDMKKMLKKVLCAGLLLAMSFTALSTQAFAYVPTYTNTYSFLYRKGLNSNEYVIENYVNKKSTGADQILIRSNVFQVETPACYITARCRNFTSNTTTISTAPSTVAIQYTGQESPKYGTNVVLYMALEEFGTSGSVKASGTVLAA